MNRKLIVVSLAVVSVLGAGVALAAGQGIEDPTPWYQFILDTFRGTGCTGCHME